MEEVELLSPAGDFDCLKAAVQNGADCVYFGADSFNARASAHNFDDDTLKKAIEYCKIRGVKTNLTLNILIKNDELEDAFNLAKKAYKYGIDAIIVQDLGLAMLLIKSFPDLPIHASTQMSVHNLQGALKLQKMGFSRIVLARELSIDEIEYICQNTSVEIECFIHGALCISYSGQCLFSSMIGGRSGNRGTCAQSCRLPYELIENNKKTIEKGYLLSPKDLCSLDFIPRLIEAGVKSFKIEGRMKSPEYVATVTKIYRKYIDTVLSKKEYKINENDKKELMQVFNRGNFSSGHFSSTPNRDLIYPDKPNNMGIFVGHVSKFNPLKGLITFNSSESLEIGDTVCIDGESKIYTISELINSNKNIKKSLPNSVITIGRIKGKFKNGAKIYKMSSKSLTQNALETIKDSNQLRKIPLNCKVKIIKGSPISIHINSASDLKIYRNLDIYYESNSIPIDAVNKPLDKEKIIEQISKTNNTPFYFKTIKVTLDDNSFITNIKALNDLRRSALAMVEDTIKRRTSRKEIECDFKNTVFKQKQTEPTISILLNKLDSSQKYSSLKDVDNIYIPLKYFSIKKYENILKELNNRFNLYIYMPTIIKPNYKNLLVNTIEEAINNYKIKGFVLSNISNFEILEQFQKGKFEYISNYTFNIFNYLSLEELFKLGITKFTISPELNKEYIQEFIQNTNQELICYGRTPLMNMSYCPLGKSNKCYPTCKMPCNTDNKYSLKDRLNLKFPILPDNTQTITTIYNSKITSIAPKDYQGDFSIRIDILDEGIKQIQEIINTVKAGKRLNGVNYTNGNQNRVV